ncbi:MAG: PROBABLE REMNANT OF A TRANSPOSASE GENE PROTEIN [uncultured Sulfurovum sp.]|uniref:PROBABLE REMNANT OF A TRANSPOSASE GENE PROTEIN n=1 Tax=uncultured Sulfurovum sp. TaxID=269237 RepID=A0A6S6TCR5_9BACT|nr:MAG: PROBABLE REMNANT OF A TRANSPOSASE GENE PROTEIN [uncultured Sulfurovum sp.]
MSNFPLEEISELQKELSSHPVYDAVQNIDDLSIFMQHHIYSVWDFMSLVKYLQNEFAPATTPWMPHGDPMIRRFINDIVLEEESDEGVPLADGTTTYISHFELYMMAMEEVKPNASDNIQRFIKKVQKGSLTKTLKKKLAPPPAKKFMRTTFDFIETDKPHIIASAFAFGREHIIPTMFQALIEKMKISREEATAFHYYLERHIELDGDHHGPLSLRMIDILCDNDPKKIEEAKVTAIHAIKARIKFWDGVLKAIEKNKKKMKK